MGAIAYILANIPGEIWVALGGIATTFFALWRGKKSGERQANLKMREELQDVRDQHAAIDATYIDDGDAYRGLRARADSD